MYVSAQILRGVAALCVVFYHVFGKKFGIHSLYVHPLAAGVDIFFIISGFVIFKSTENADRRAIFLARRIYRIAPIWFIALTLWILYQHYGHGLSYPIGKIIKSYLFVFYAGDTPDDHGPIYGVGWTLNYEMLFYVLWGCVVMAVPSRYPRTRALVSLAIFTALIFSRVIFRPATGPWSVVADYQNTVMWEFCAGSLIAAFEPQLKKIMSPPLGLALVVVGILLLWAGDTYARDLPRVIVFGAPAIMIFAGAIRTEKYAPKLGWLPRSLGDASYSIYLIHPFPLEIGLVDTMALQNPVFQTWPALLLWSVVLTFISYLFYAGVERPINNYGKKLFRKKRKPPAEMLIRA
jgi:exopolysaccharide production protein ExoZ